ALWVGQAGLGARREVEGELGPEDRGHAHGVGGLGEADDAVHAVVVGGGQGLEAETGCLLDQLLGVGCPVEEAEVGVAVELGVGHRPRAADDSGRRLIRWAVAGLGVGRAGHGLPPGQPPLQLGPRHVRVVEPHGPAYYRTYVRLALGYLPGAREHRHEFGVVTPSHPATSIEKRHTKERSLHARTTR